MKIYNYHSITGEYLGESIADESPLEPGVCLIPAHATAEAPPQARTGQIARYLDNAWRVVEDVRGDWWHYDGTHVTVTDLDADVSGMTSTAPPDAVSVFDGRAWVLDATKASAAARATADAAVAAGMSEAAHQIAVLQDAVDLAIATEAEAQAHKDWRRYRVLLIRVQSDPAYPDVTLPDQPEHAVP